MLSFCQVGHSYPISQLTPIQGQLMMEFSHLGIIYHSPHSSRFYPTQIAVNIISTKKTPTNETTSTSSSSTTTSSSSSSSLLASSSVPTPIANIPPTVNSNRSNISGLELIVETNFQVVAYCSSDLHLAMLSLFVDTRGMISLPNMTLGQITRDSIKYALKMGIKAQQIINFMLIHSHPRLLNRNPIIPENVTDQIKLWESERYRIKSQSSVFIDLPELFSGRQLDDLYVKLKKYSQEINVLLWCNDKKKYFVVTVEGYHQLEAYSRTIT